MLHRAGSTLLSAGRRRALVAITALLAAAAFAAVHLTTAAAISTCSVNWTGAANNGLWADAGNWDTNAVPASSDNVCIAGGATVTVSGSAQSVGSLTLGTQGAGSEPTLVIDGGSSNATLTLGGDSANYGTITLTNTYGYDSYLTLSAGTLTNAGLIQGIAGNGGARHIQGNVTNTGTIDAETTTYFDGAGKTLDNEGVLTAASGVLLDVPNGTGATVVNDTGGSVTNNGGSGKVWLGSGNTFEQGDGTISPATANPSTPAVVVYNSTVDYTGTGAGTIAATSCDSNHGTLEGNLAAGQNLVVESNGSCSAFLDASSSFTNAGTITLVNYAGDAAVLTVASGTLTNSGTIVADPGAGGYRYLRGDVTNTGTIDVNTQSYFDQAGTTLDNEGAIDIATGTVLSVPSSKGSTVINDAGGSISNGSGNGYLTLDSGNTFEQGDGTISSTAANPSAPAVYVYDGTVDFTGTGPGTVVAQSCNGGTLSGNLASDQNLVVVQAGSCTASETAASSFTNAGTITLLNTYGYAAVLAVSSGTLTNSGTIVLDPGKGGYRYLRGDITNTGTIDVNVASYFDQTGTTLDNEGAISIAAGQWLSVPASKGSTVINDTGGSISNGSGNGYLTLDSGNTFEQGAGTISPATANPSTPAVYAYDSAVDFTGTGAGTIVAQSCNGGTLSGDLASDQNLVVVQAGSCTASETAASSFTNAGTITLLNTYGYDAVLTLTSGTLTNRGTIVLAPGAGGNRYLRGNITNTGTIDVNDNTNFDKAGTTLENEGAISVAAGMWLSIPDSKGSTIVNDAGGSISNGSGNGYVSLGSGNTFEQGAGTISPATAQPSSPAVYMYDSTLDYTGTGAGTIVATACNGGTLNGNLASGQNLMLESGSCAGPENASGSFTNAGTITLLNTYGYDETLSIPSGSTLTNAGTLVAQLGGGGADHVAGTVDNTGTLEVDSRAGLTVTDLTNVSGSTLSGGSYDLAGWFTASNAAQTITTNDARLILRTGGSMSQLAPTSNTGNGELDVVGRNYTVGAFANAGTVDVSSSGSLFVTGDFTQSAGTTTVENGSTLSPSGQVALAGGTLTGDGTVASAVDNTGGTVEPATASGSPATLSVSGAYTQGSAGTLKVDVAGGSTGDFSVLAAGNAASLDGALAIATDKTYTPAACTTYAIATGSSESGSFASLSGARPAAGIEYLPSYDASGSATLTAAGTPDAPANVQATAGTGKADVGWNPPAANCSDITSYTVRAHPDGETGTADDVTAQVTAPATSTTLTGLTDGTTYDVTVLATNAVGDGPASSPVQITLAQPAPVTAITGGPADNSWTNNASPTFTYSSNEAGSTFECKVDAGSFATCPVDGDTLSNLADGSHTFSVRAVNGSNVADSSPPSRTFTVDTAAPALTLTAPASPTNDTKPAFSGAGGTADGDNGTVTVKLFQGTGIGGTPVGSTQTATVTSGAWSTPALSSALSDGTYTVQAVQTDKAGNSTSKTATFTVDTAAPSLAITGGPADGSLTNDASPTFSFTAGNDAASVQCELDSGGFRNCSTAGSDTLASLADGQHTWSVEATDQAGNTATASRAFTVDATPPAVTLASPADGASYTEGQVVDASYSCTDVNLTSCAGPVASGAAIDTSTPGKHTFTVTATDGAGNTTSKPATYTVTSTSQPPTVKITGSLYTDDRSVMVPLTCRAASGEQCVVDFALTAREADGKRVQPVDVGDVQHTLSAGVKRTVRVRLNAEGRKLLGEPGQFAVTVSISVGGQVVAKRHIAFSPPR